MYNVGTVTTTANSTKLIGVGTKWKENINLVLPMQMIQIQIGNTVHNNSIHSIQSNTELTLNFPIPTAQTGAKYVIFTTTMDSISAAANAIVAMNSSNVQFSDIQNRIMTESGVIDVKLPDGTVRKTRTEAERDKLLDGKFDKAGGDINGRVTVNSSTIRIIGTDDWPGLSIRKKNGEEVRIEASNTTETLLDISYRDTENKRLNTFIIPRKSGTAMTVGEYGIGIAASPIKTEDIAKDWSTRFVATPGEPGVANSLPWGVGVHIAENAYGCVLHYDPASKTLRTCSTGKAGAVLTSIHTVYSAANTTKDSNGNLKAASPIVKVFAEHIETNDEAEGVTMQKLGIGHYLIKGVVGFNADGVWGINNGFVIPQDHNGKNMVLIDYEVRPDGDIEVFVFHQQNADLPERFQNKRIKHLDKDGNPVYYENYEPCDVPESRWIDMRVEMPVNSIYNLKQAEAERLAKEAAEKQAEEDAKKAELEAEEGGDI
ncbi:TPA: cell envelope integrity protein TolA [Providencia stuartii]